MKNDAFCAGLALEGVLPGYFKIDLLIKNSVFDSIYLPKLDELSFKNDEQSKKLRFQGNELFKQRKWFQASQLYTKSLCYAVDDKLAALAYSNRAAALFKLNYKGGLDDIERAMKLGYPDDMKFKLETKRAKFLCSIKEMDQAQKSIEKAIKYVENSDLSKNMVDKLSNDLQKLSTDCSEESSFFQLPKALASLFENEEKMPDLNERHTIFSSLTRDCDVEVHEGRGRVVVAKRKFSPGELIAIEKPYSKKLYYDKLSSHCSHCFKHCLNGIPCRKCPFMVFCSADCQLRSVHNMDCHFIKYLIKSDLQECPILALNTVSNIPASEVCNYKREKISEEMDTERMVVTTNGKYEWNDYKAICDLVTNEDKRSTKDKTWRVFKAAYLLKVLETSPYFDTVPEKDLMEVKVMVAYLLYIHQQSFPSNCHTLSEFVIDPASCQTSTDVAIGCGAFSTLSLFNHSCTPNVCRFNMGEAVIVRSMAVIEEGEEIKDNYGVLSELTEKKERLDTLYSQYYFKCTCEACENNWPTLDVYPYQKYFWKCPQCTKVLVEKNEILKCTKCATTSTTQKKLAQLHKFEKRFEISHELLLDFHPKEALPAVLELMEFLHKNCTKPLKAFSLAAEYFKQIYSFQGNKVLKYE